jgi:tetratricopeptide (TPR) repeat protein
MKHLFLFIAFLAISFSGLGQIKLLNPDSPVEAKYTSLVFLHTQPGMPLKEGQTVNPGDPIATVAPHPAKRSAKFEKQLEQSIQLYSKGSFAQAAEVLQKAVTQEPDNPFLLEAYARALYQIDDRKPESYRVYKKLVSQLDAQSASPTALTLDTWFMEAYWKLGTLHMDNGHWNAALLEIGKFMLMASTMKDQPIYEQALSYLTECAFELKDKTLCAHFGKRTLEVNPNNDYVPDYLAHLDTL